MNQALGPTMLDVLFCLDGLASAEETLALKDYLLSNPDQAEYFGGILGYSVSEALQARVCRLTVADEFAEGDAGDVSVGNREVASVVEVTGRRRVLPARISVVALAAMVALVLVTSPFLMPRSAVAAQTVINRARLLMSTTLVSADSREAGVAEAVQLIEKLRALPLQSGVVECDRQLTLAALLRLLALQEAEGRNAAVVRAAVNRDSLLALASEAVTASRKVPDHADRRWQKEDEIQCALHVRATLALETAFTVNSTESQVFYARCVDDTLDGIDRLNTLLQDPALPVEFAESWNVLRQDAMLLLGRSLNKGNFEAATDRLERLEALIPALAAGGNTDGERKKTADQLLQGDRSAPRAIQAAMLLLQRVTEEQSRDPRAIVLQATALNSIGMVQKRSTAPESLQRAMTTFTKGITLLESLRNNNGGTGLAKQVLPSGVEQSPLLVLGKLCGNAADSLQVDERFEEQARYGRMAELALTEALHANRDDEIIKALGWVQSRLLIALWRWNVRSPKSEIGVRIHATAHSLRLFSNEFTDFDGFSISVSETAICRAVAAQVFDDVRPRADVFSEGVQQMSQELTTQMQAAANDPNAVPRSLGFLCNLFRESLQLPAFSVPEKETLLQQIAQGEEFVRDAPQ